MSMNPLWQLLGLLLFIAVFVAIHRSSRYAEEDPDLTEDTYHASKSDHGKEDEDADS